MPHATSLLRAHISDHVTGTNWEEEEKKKRMRGTVIATAALISVVLTLNVVFFYLRFNALADKVCEYPKPSQARPANE
jgi:hypothetical protein